MTMRHDDRPLELLSSPSQRASSAVSAVISAFALAGALGVIGSALYWIGTLVVNFLARGSWLALSALGVALLFAVAWFLRSSVLGRIWFIAALVLAAAFVAPFIQRTL
jgi:hypothetical protein